jgi:hypothetical protein
MQRESYDRSAGGRWHTDLYALAVLNYWDAALYRAILEDMVRSLCDQPYRLHGTMLHQVSGSNWGKGAPRLFWCIFVQKTRTLAEVK